MPATDRTLTHRLGRICTDVAAALLAGVTRSSQSAAEARLAELGAARQRQAVAAILGVLLVCAFIAAQFGMLGMAIYLGAVVLIVR